MIATKYHTFIQFSSVAQLCLTLCNPVDCSTPGFPVHHQLPELTFMAPPLPQWPCARRTGQPRRVKGPKRHALVLMGTPLSRLQLSLEGTVSIRRPAGWLLPSKPASPYGPVRRAPRTQPSDGLAVGEHPGAQAPALAGEGRVLGGRRG